MQLLFVREGNRCRRCTRIEDNVFGGRNERYLSVQSYVISINSHSLHSQSKIGEIRERTIYSHAGLKFIHEFSIGIPVQGESEVRRIIPVMKGLVYYPRHNFFSI